MSEMTRIVAAEDSHKARFTTAEFLGMCATGGFDGINIELVEGRLERMPPPGNKHGLVQIGILKRLLAVLDERLVRAEQAIDLGHDTLVGCDAAVLREPLDAVGILEPADLLLVVEVAETTLRRDLEQKRLRYAAAGVLTYWVVDGKRAEVHAHWEPADGDYRQITVVRFGEPLAVPGTDATITLA